MIIVGQMKLIVPPEMTVGFSDVSCISEIYIMQNTMVGGGGGKKKAGLGKKKKRE